MILLFLACSPSDLTRPELWDPAVMPATDGLYVDLPAAHGLALVPPGSPARRVDVGEGAIRGTVVAPDATRAGAFVDRYRCEVDDARDARHVDTLEDCATPDLEVDTSFVAIEAGRVSSEAPLPGPYNRFAWSPSSRFAVAWVDAAALAVPGRIVNTTAIEVIDADAGTAATVSIGVAPREVLFTPDSGRAIVLAQDSVAVVALSTGVRDVRYPLTLDPDNVVEPVGVGLTPDGRYALVSVAGAGDLYVLDLVDPSVNIVSLAGPPSAMVVDPVVDRTVLVYPGKPVAEIVDHERFDIEVVGLDEPATAIAPAGEGVVVLYTPGGRDVVRLDLVTGDTVEYRLQHELQSIAVAPGGDVAIAFTAGIGAGPGMELLDLGDDDTYPYLLEGPGVAAAFVDTEVLILQGGVDAIAELDLATGAIGEVDLDEPPLGIGTMPDGRFYVTQAAELGLVSFLDPATDRVTTASGFGALGYADPILVEVP